LLRAFGLYSGFAKTAFEGTFRISYDLSRTDRLNVVSFVADDLEVNGEEEVRDKVALVEEVVILVRREEQRKFLLEKLAGSTLLPRITVLVKSSTET